MAIHWQLAFEACVDGQVFKFRATKTWILLRNRMLLLLNIRTTKLLIFPSVN